MSRPQWAKGPGFESPIFHDFHKLFQCCGRLRCGSRNGCGVKLLTGPMAVQTANARKEVQIQSPRLDYCEAVARRFFCAETAGKFARPNSQNVA
jgi:hypothetical protein